MNINTNELFTEELSDECAYHLIQFFFNFALIFEGMHLVKAMRHEKALMRANDPCAGFLDDDELEENEDEPPF